MRTHNKLDRPSQCININRKDVHASIISINGKICVRNMGG